MLLKDCKYGAVVFHYYVPPTGDLKTYDMNATGNMGKYDCPVGHIVGFDKADSGEAVPIVRWDDGSETAINRRYILEVDW